MEGGGRRDDRRLRELPWVRCPGLTTGNSVIDGDRILHLCLTVLPVRLSTHRAPPLPPLRAPLRLLPPLRPPPPDAYLPWCSSPLTGHPQASSPAYAPRLPANISRCLVLAFPDAYQRRKRQWQRPGLRVPPPSAPLPFRPATCVAHVLSRRGPGVESPCIARPRRHARWRWQQGRGSGGGSPRRCRCGYRGARWSRSPVRCTFGWAPLWAPPPDSFRRPEGWDEGGARGRGIAVAMALQHSAAVGTASNAGDRCGCGSGGGAKIALANPRRHNAGARRPCCATWCSTGCSWWRGVGRCS